MERYPWQPGFRTQAGSCQARSDQIRETDRITRDTTHSAVVCFPHCLTNKAKGCGAFRDYSRLSTVSVSLNDPPYPRLLSRSLDVGLTWITLSLSLPDWITDYTTSDDTYCQTTKIKVQPKPLDSSQSLYILWTSISVRLSGGKSIHIL